MYVRTIKRTNKDGSVVEYVQLAHNEWNKEKGFAQARVLYSFGRRDRLDVEAIRRLVRSLNRFLGPEDVIRQEHNHEDLHFEKSRQAGGAYLLRGLWDRLGIDTCLKKAIKERDFSAPILEAIFAMVANRALSPSSKLAIGDWVRDYVYLGRSEKSQALQVQHFYRAMDFLLEHAEDIQKKVFWATATLLNLTVDLIFFDTTNTYFETDDPGDSKLKAYGHSKHKRDDLPQVTIGLAVTREGMPVRCWVLPGNQHDAKSVEKVQEELKGWNLGRIYWVMDRGMTSQENKRILQRAGGHYILGEKLSGNHLNEVVLSTPGRFKRVKDNLHVKEVVMDHQRYVIVYNPEQAKLDRMSREKILEHLNDQLKIANQGSSKAKCKAILHGSMGRYVKEQKNGKLKIDRTKVKQAQKLDGKYLLSTSDLTMSTEDIALGYKQLLEVERAFRTLKSSLGLRPIYHSRDDRITSHVLLCWLSLVLIRMAEIETNQTWREIRHQMQQIHLIQFSDQKNRILQHTELTNNQRNILKKLKIKPPKRIVSIEPVQ